MTTQTKRFTAGRFLQAATVGRGHLADGIAWAEAQGHWLDRSTIVSALKSAVSAANESDFMGSYQPVAESFLAAMRPYSVPMRLESMKRVPMLTRVLANDSRILVSEVTPGAPIPVARMTLADATLTPRYFSGICAQAEELMRSTSPLAALAIENDLAEATAEAENLAFLSPSITGSVLNGKPNFAASGSAIANIVTDLDRLVGLVPGAWRPGCAFTMSKDTATYLATRRDAGGAAFPELGPQGGTLLGLPVLISQAMDAETSPAERKIGLLDPNEILWADEGQVKLTASGDTAIQMLDNPTNSSASSVTATSIVSMFQTRTVALRATRASSWYARTASGAYFVAGY